MYNERSHSTWGGSLDDLDLDQCQIPNVILHIPYGAMCLPNIKGFQFFKMGAKKLFLGVPTRPKCLSVFARLQWQ